LPVRLPAVIPVVLTSTRRLDGVVPEGGTTLNHEEPAVTTAVIAVGMEGLVSIDRVCGPGGVAPMVHAKFKPEGVTVRGTTGCVIVSVTGNEETGLNGPLNRTDPGYTPAVRPVGLMVTVKGWPTYPSPDVFAALVGVTDSQLAVVDAPE
jgi:hypothetical protein